MRYTRAGTLALMLCGLAACSSTTMRTTWAGPDPSQMAFRHTLVLFVSRDAAMRRAAEDRMAGEISGSLQSYAVIPEESIQDKDLVRKLIDNAGYDGVFVMRLQAVESGLSGTPAIPSARFVAMGGTFDRVSDLWVDWNSSWNLVYGPNYLYDNQLVTVESAVYSVKDGQMVWAGQSETLNPKSLKSLINSVVHKSVAEMREHGFTG